MSHYALEVGQLYNPARTSYPQTEQIRIDRSLQELVRYWPSPTRSEVQAHESGAADFALIDRSPHVLLLSYKFGDLDWSDAPFQAHRMTTSAAGWPAGGPSLGLLFTTVLVDADTGVIRALRIDEWPPEFANPVRVAVAEQLIHDLDDDAAGRELDALYGAYSTPEAMVEAEALTTCRTEGAMAGGARPLTINYY